MFKTYEFKDFSFEIFNDPANKISKTSQDELTWECTQLEKDTSGHTRLHLADTRQQLFDTSTLILGRDKSRHIFSFSTSNVINIDLYHIIYLKYTVVSCAHQGKGFYSILLALKILEEAHKIKQSDSQIDENHILLGSRTQNPLVYHVCDQKLGLFPQSSSHIDDPIQDVMPKFAKCLYDEDLLSNETTHKSGALALYDRHTHPGQTHKNPWVFLGYYHEEQINRLYVESKRKLGGDRLWNPPLAARAASLCRR